MMLGEEMYAQAAALAGQLEEGEKDLLHVVCQLTAQSLTDRLKEGLTVSQCRGALVRGGSLYALAALRDIRSDGDVQQLKAGDLTIQRSGSSADACRAQADALLRPYLKDRFLFQGV